MANLIQAIRGMNDILPEESLIWQKAEKTMRDILHSFGYEEVRFPIVEKTELFKRSIGEATDIVEKEMYTFLDRNNDSLTLRPEGTAGCVRAGIEHGLLYNQIQRLWYMGGFFRYERPQKGRYRQFHQCGAEIFGLPGPDIDAELIVLSAAILEKLGLSKHVNLHLNSLGSIESRKHYREELINYFSNRQNQLDEDSQRRLLTNPLRILDSKNPEMQELIHHAPKLIHSLDDESKKHFDSLKDMLNHYGLPLTVNPNLVRGLDYYTKTVFEWVTEELGAQGTVCAGGRYDGLVEQLGGRPTPALGFAFGMERTILLLQKLHPASKPAADVYFMSDNENAFQKALVLSHQLRKNFPGVVVIHHCGGGGFKNQFKKADKSGAKYAFILGEQEIQTSQLTIKSLREEAPQISISQEKMIAWWQDRCKIKNPC